MVALTGLLVMELPGETVRLCDGGFFYWGSDLFLSEHETFGTVESVEALSEGAGEEVPALSMTFIPASAAAAADLSQPGFQKSRVRFYIAEYAPDTGLLVGMPELQFDGQLDKTTLKFSKGTRTLDTEVVSTAERLFMRNDGNSLNASWHKSIWPGELGHDEASGLTVSIAWGVESPNASRPSGWFNPSVPGIAAARARLGYD